MSNIKVTDKKHQTMESFGASGAWWSQIVNKKDCKEKNNGI